MNQGIVAGLLRKETNVFDISDWCRSFQTYLVLAYVPIFLVSIFFVNSLKSFIF